MESDLIFAYGFGFSTPDCDEFIPLIKARGAMGVNWYELEARLTIEDGVETKDRHSCLGVQSWVDPNRLKCPLSGPIVLTTSYFVVHESIYPYTNQGLAIQFHSLRHVVWQRSEGECWLDLQIKWDHNKFLGIISVLDKHMKPKPSFI